MQALNRPLSLALAGALLLCLTGCGQIRPSGTELADRYSIYAALQLYLDFINIFLYLIRLLGYANRD